MELYALSPKFSENQKTKRKEQCQIKVGKYTFTSVAHYETVAEARSIAE